MNRGLKISLPPHRQLNLLERLKLPQIHPKLFFKSTTCPVPGAFPRLNQAWPVMRASRISSWIFPAVWLKFITTVAKLRMSTAWHHPSPPAGIRPGSAKFIRLIRLKKEEALATSRAKFYIASVGGWDISRTDFNTELAFAKKGYQNAYGENVFTGDKGKTVLDSIKAQIVSRLINEGIQMQEVQRVGFRVDPKTVDREFEKFLTEKELDLEGLKATLGKSEYPFDYFMKKFENRVLLSRYLDEKVFNETAADDYDKQNQYQAWFNTARVLSKVTIYDQELKRVSQNASAGGGCGQSSGASCCSTKKS